VPVLLHIMQTGEAFDTGRWCAAHSVALPAPKATPQRRKRQHDSEHDESAQQVA
jgi:hypothetical protein